LPDADSGELEEVIADRIRKKKAKEEQAQAKTLEELIALGKSRNYRNPAMWAKYVLEARGWHELKLKKKLTDEEEKIYKRVTKKVEYHKTSEFKLKERQKKYFTKERKKKYRDKFNLKLTLEQRREKNRKGELSRKPEQRRERNRKRQLRKKRKNDRSTNSSSHPQNASQPS
jgi:hypothetical protein